MLELHNNYMVDLAGGRAPGGGWVMTDLPTMQNVGLLAGFS